MPTSAKQPILAVDFGTSNSAAATLLQGKVVRIPLEPNSDTMPTSVFFNSDDRSTSYGTAANDSLAEGFPGRYMRSLKSILGSSLMSESRLLNGKRMDGFDVVTDYLITLKSRAEIHIGHPFTRALSGRPVHFKTRDAIRDAQAEEDLKECYMRAGFQHVEFMREPEAAALSEQHNLRKGGLCLVVDIGGGTSDFTVFRKPALDTSSTTIDVLASHGIKLGGTDFDRQTSLKFMMPQLGHGSRIRRTMGHETVVAPISIYADLSTWEKIPFLYKPKTLRDVKELIYLAPKKRPFERLEYLIEHEIGHDLAILTEKTKIALNSAQTSTHQVDLSLLERGLGMTISVQEFDEVILQSSDIIQREIEATLTMAQCDAREVTQIIEVGGGGKMKLVRKSLEALFPQAEILSGATFTAVVDGLALATQPQAQ